MIIFFFYSLFLGVFTFWLFFVCLFCWELSWISSQISGERGSFDTQHKTIQKKDPQQLKIHCVLFLFLFFLCCIVALLHGLYPNYGRGGSYQQTYIYNFVMNCCHGYINNIMDLYPNFGRGRKFCLLIYPSNKTLQKT